jgi:hypothetical protein
MPGGEKGIQIFLRVRPSKKPSGWIEQDEVRKLELDAVFASLSREAHNLFLTSVAFPKPSSG